MSIRKHHHSLLNILVCDLNAQRQGRTTYLSFFRALLFGRGFHLITIYRIQRGLRKIPLIGWVCAYFLSYISSVIYSCDISFKANIAPGIFIPHPIGIIIGEGAKIKSNVTIFQNVTIGRKSVYQSDYPIIEESVILGAGCVILGNVTIGKGAFIGANSVVLKDIAQNSTAVGVPAEIVKNL